MKKAPHQHHYEKGTWNGEPPYSAPNPTRMSRSVPKGSGGDKWTIPNTATYGLGVGKEPTRMSRSVGKGEQGSSIDCSTKGPAISSRKDTGANTYQGLKYGVGGVDGSADGGYGGS